jgi:hypothetical protein
LAYITVGTLTAVWSAIWWVYLREHPPQYESTYYWCYTFMATGVALLIIGLGVGQIGRSARHADLPPPEVTPAVEKVEQNAAARAPIVGNVNPAAPGQAGNGQTASTGQVAGGMPVATMAPMAGSAPVAAPPPVAAPHPAVGPQRKA